VTDGTGQGRPIGARVKLTDTFTGRDGGGNTNDPVA